MEFYRWFAPVGLALLVFCVASVYLLRRQRPVAPIFWATWIAAVVVQTVVAVATDRSDPVPRNRGLGDFVALVVMCGLPLVAASISFTLQRQSVRSPFLIGTWALAAGLLLFIASPWTALFVACYLNTENCI